MPRFLRSILVLLLCNSALGHASNADLIIYGDHVLTMEPGATVIADGAVVVKDDLIVAVGPRQEIDRSYIGKKTIEAIAQHFEGKSPPKIVPVEVGIVDWNGGIVVRRCYDIVRRIARG